ncbi:MAG: hypothetical protein OQL19_14175 [Gammaproteobacteria bacterium]|nr:hypothetical protein [Gammaproteobacteria bacterium]
MFSSNSDIRRTLGDFHIDGMTLRYSRFVPKLYNWCKSLGFEAGKIVPSRAFCSDESQGFPIILIAKHFGAFPFNHGRVGGIVSTGRHGPHASHGKDMLIIQASHVGYDPHNNNFGHYRRLQTEHNCDSSNCGKISHTLSWYQQLYTFAKKNILLEKQDDRFLIHIDNQILKQDKPEGVFLNLELMAASDNSTSHNSNGKILPLYSRSTAKTYVMSEYLQQRINTEDWKDNSLRAIGDDLGPDLFRFKHEIQDDIEGPNRLEQNLLPAMSWIVTSPEPMLTAALVNTQTEFDRTYRTIVNEPGYQGKNLVFISGLNIDISPEPGQLFPLTKFVPWAAYVQTTDGTYYTVEQKELFEILEQESDQNSDRIDMEAAIRIMEEAQEIQLHLPPALKLNN